MAFDTTSSGRPTLRLLLPLLVAIGSLACSSCASHGPEVDPSPPGTDPPLPPPVTDDGGSVDGSVDGSADGSVDGEPPMPPPPPPPPGTARSSANVFFIGHSLMGWSAPSMMTEFAALHEVDYRYEAAIGIGANLAWQREHPDFADGANPTVALGDRPFDVLVLTEAIPIEQHFTYSGSVDNALFFIGLAYGQNPNVQVYLNETWDHLTVDDWRSQIVTDRAIYDQIIDGVNARFEGRDLFIIPGGQGMRALTDRVREGGVPGISNVEQLFADDIHLSDLGWYFIACVHYATLFQRSPVGVPVATTDRAGFPFLSAPSPEAARVMQEIAWEVVSNDPRSGVR